jgi:hypothetical protein
MVASKLLALPWEIRSQICAHIFRGETLRWDGGVYRHNAQYRQLRVLPARCMDIRFVSKQCYEETTTIFFAEVLLNVTELIDPEYGSYSNAVDPELLKNVCLHIMIEDLAPVKALNAMKNLEKLHFALDDGYVGSFPAPETILSDPKKRLEDLESRSKDIFELIAGDHAGYDSFPRCAAGVIGAWQSRNKEFELVGEALVGDLKTNTPIAVSPCTLSLLQETLKN